MTNLNSVIIPLLVFLAVGTATVLYLWLNPKAFKVKPEIKQDVKANQYELIDQFEERLVGLKPDLDDYRSYIRELEAHLLTRVEHLDDKCLMRDRGIREQIGDYLLLRQRALDTMVELNGNSFFLYATCRRIATVEGYITPVSLRTIPSDAIFGSDFKAVCDLVKRLGITNDDPVASENYRSGFDGLFTSAGLVDLHDRRYYSVADIARFEKISVTTELNINEL